ncbi:ribonuclease T2 [Chlorella sorokiniana]|uniref:Ribonuclease T2 n=1 Tax=Chlorella sorokiniana TaxID=3076 RepID=A0A2P6TRX8_CHLSO|nr:ribonuclease T2 [Chlorella sorokiniana]|eukprot:PRW56823.1 ribonuclease T2 [Chlorella sorokiniana]
MPIAQRASAAAPSPCTELVPRPLFNPPCSGAFRVNRLYGADANGKDLTGCKGAAFSAVKVPADLRAQLDCVWPSYAVPNNNEQLWRSVWAEADEGGLCTGLLQGQWMRLAMSLRDRYNVDAVLFNSSLASGSTSGADITQALLRAYGKQPHIACKAGVPKVLSSVSLCFKLGSYDLVDCPAAWKSDCQGPLVVTPGPLPSDQCAEYYPGVTKVLPAAAAAPSPSPAPQLAQPSAALPSPAPAVQPSPAALPQQPSPSPVTVPLLPSPVPSPAAIVSSPAVEAPSQTEAGVAGSPVSSSASSSSGGGSSGISTGAGVGIAVGIAAAIVGAAGVGAYYYLRKPAGAAAAAEELGSDKLGSKSDPEAGSEAGVSGRMSSDARMPARSSSWSPGHTYTARYA